MNVRITLKKPFDHFVLEKDTPEARITFWSIVEGYRLRGTPYVVEWGSGVLDKNGRELFEGDVVYLKHRTIDRNKQVVYSIDDKGVVRYVDGGFYVVNRDISYEVSSDYGPETSVHLYTILGHQMKKDEVSTPPSV